MRTKIVAVTVGEHYYLRGNYCVKYLVIGKRLDSTRFWHVKQSDCDYRSYDDATYVVFQYTKSRSIPYFHGVKHGQVITQKQIVELEKYGVAV